MGLVARVAEHRREPLDPLVGQRRDRRVRRRDRREVASRVDDVDDAPEFARPKGANRGSPRCGPNPPGDGRMAARAESQEKRDGEGDGHGDVGGEKRQEDDDKTVGDAGEVGTTGRPRRRRDAPGACRGPRVRRGGVLRERRLGRADGGVALGRLGLLLVPGLGLPGLGLFLLLVEVLDDRPAEDLTDLLALLPVLRAERPKVTVVARMVPHAVRALVVLLADGGPFGRT
mmetsp:Transcript_19407/g.62299  ORF Transcript_19407/g.62299 Transcript_19407/m.62299 type:complete len:230 (+) Transcript_19407:3631-4320(+)